MQPTYPKLLRNGGYKFMSICTVEFTFVAFLVSRVMSLGSFLEQQPAFQVQTLDVIATFGVCNFTESFQYLCYFLNIWVTVNCALSEADLIFSQIHTCYLFDNFQFVGNIVWNILSEREKERSLILLLNIKWILKFSLFFFSRVVDTK